MAERVKELERAEKETKQAQAKELKQRQRELADAKKKVAKELQAASRMVQKGEREANRLTTKADQVEKQAEQTKAKAARQQSMVDESLGRIHAKRNGLESTLHEKMSVIGEARGRLAHAAFAAKMLEAGVIVPIDGTAEFDAAATRPRPRPRRIGANGEVLEAEEGDEEGDADAQEGEDNDLVRMLREENRGLRERLREVEAELASLKVVAGAAPTAESWRMDWAPVAEGARAAADDTLREFGGASGEVQCNSRHMWSSDATVADPSPGGHGALAASASAPALHLGGAAGRSHIASFAGMGGPVAACRSGGLAAQAAFSTSGPQGAMFSGAATAQQQHQQYLAQHFPAQQHQQFPAQQQQQLPAAISAGGVAPQQRLPFEAFRGAESEPRLCSALQAALAKPAAYGDGPPPSLLAHLRSMASPAKGVAAPMPTEPVAAPPAHVLGHAPMPILGATRVL